MMIILLPDFGLVRESCDDPPTVHWCNNCNWFNQKSYMTVSLRPILG